MEGFETRGNIPTTLKDLVDQGYTSQQRGGAVHARKGVRVDQVQVIRGLDLQPCVLAQWTDEASPHKTCIGIRTFITEEQLDQWIQEWDIRLSRHLRRIVQS